MTNSVYAFDQAEAERFLRAVLGAGVQPALVPIKPGKKRPGVKWKHLAAGAVVRAWEPGTNAYGVLTGERSINAAGLALVAIELDQDPATGADGAAALRALAARLGPLPDGLTIASGGGDGAGRHRYFLTDVPIKTAAGRAGTPLHGFDRRGHGGQILIGGSVHPRTGRVYRVINDAPPPILPDAWAQYLRRDGRHERARAHARATHPGEAVAAQSAAEVCFVACGGRLTGPGRGDCPFPDAHARSLGIGTVEIDECAIRCWGNGHAGEHAHEFDQSLRAANPSAYTAWTRSTARLIMDAETARAELHSLADGSALVSGAEAGALVAAALERRAPSERLLLHVDSGAGKTWRMARDLIRRASAGGLHVLALPTHKSARDVEREHAEAAEAAGVTLIRAEGWAEVCQLPAVKTAAAEVGLSPHDYGACFTCAHRPTCEAATRIGEIETAAKGARRSLAIVSHAMIPRVQTAVRDAGGSPPTIYLDENPREPIVTVEIDGADLDAFRKTAEPGGALDTIAGGTMRRRRGPKSKSRAAAERAIADARAALDAINDGVPVESETGDERKARHDAEASARAAARVAVARAERDATTIEVAPWRAAGDRARALLDGTGRDGPPFTYMQADGFGVAGIWRTWRALARARDLGAEIPTAGGLRVAAWNPILRSADVVATAAPLPASAHVLAAEGVRTVRVRVADASGLIVRRTWFRTGQSMSGAFVRDRAGWEACFRRHVLPAVDASTRALVAVSTKAQAEVARALLARLGDRAEVVHMGISEGRNSWRGVDLVIAFGGMVPRSPEYGRGLDIDATINDSHWPLDAGAAELAQVMGRARTRAERREGEPGTVRLIVVGRVAPSDWAGLDVAIETEGARDPEGETAGALALIVARAGSKRAAAKILGVDHTAITRWQRGCVPVERRPGLVATAAGAPN